MTKNQPQPPTTMIPWLASAIVVAGVVSGCATEAKTLDPTQIEKQYGVSGAYTGSVATPGGPMQGTIIPSRWPTAARRSWSSRNARPVTSVRCISWTTTVCIRSSSKKTRAAGGHQRAVHRAAAG
jgi:hypothetical protein